MSDIFIAAIGVPMWIVTLPWNAVLGAIFAKIIPGVFDHTIVPGLLIAAVSAIANVAILWSISGSLKGPSTAGRDAFQRLLSIWFVVSP
jgi:hypothetical protein